MSEDVRTALKRAADVLGTAGVEQPRLTAELLLARILACDRLAFVSQPGRLLPAGMSALFLERVNRRAAGEPLQYILGETEFYGLPFRVTPAVLIPRPETEILVEGALRIAAQMSQARLRFADAGTGSGCIAVAFALREPRAWGIGTDISSEALLVARENSSRHGVGRRLSLARCDMLQAVSERAGLDLIFSNPPYVALAHAARLPALVRDHEPRIALFAGADGLDLYRRLVPQAAACLRPGGRLLMELGAGMADGVASLVEASGLEVLAIEKDLQQIPRCLIGAKPL